MCCDRMAEGGLVVSGGRVQPEGKGLDAKLLTRVTMLVN